MQPICMWLDYWYTTSTTKPLTCSRSDDEVTASILVERAGVNIIQSNVGYLLNRLFNPRNRRENVPNGLWIFVARFVERIRFLDPKLPLCVALLLGPSSVSQFKIGQFVQQLFIYFLCDVYCFRYRIWEHCEVQNSSGHSFDCQILDMDYRYTSVLLSVPISFPSMIHSSNIKCRKKWPVPQWNKCRISAAMSH